MQQILVLIGLSGSGKSTFAKNYCQQNPNWLRINRDDLRRSLIPGSLAEFWQSEPAQQNRVEKLVGQLLRTAVKEALQNGWNVLVDNTHLRRTYLNEVISLAQGRLVEIRFKLIDTDLATCLARDQARPDQVGGAVIQAQYARLAMLRKNFDFNQVITVRPRLSQVAQADETLPPCVIVDIDGTVAERADRSPFDWGRVGEDRPKWPVIRLVKLLEKSGYAIVFFSGRDAVCRPQTVAWLNQFFEWQNEDYQLFMRAENDSRKDSIIKKELYEAHVVGRYWADLVVDDRNQVVDMWRQELGLTCLQVDYGDF
ncbi:MAG: AAA family ATPase [Bernardetiaceae bacterium]|jgi:predicted kinase|nr:AAA family ATPase [Bernardetiaceae bacterium]